MLTPRILSAAFISFGLSTAAFAVPVDIEDISGVWSSTTPTIDGIGTSSIRWGVPGFDRQSGYDFTAAGDRTVETDDPFVLGTFNHLNFPISGQALQSAVLEVSFRIGGLTSPIVSTFSFLHNETLNDQPQCPNGQAFGVGVNAQGCADLVTATVNRGLSQSFEIDGSTFLLDVLGFQFQGETFEDFFTEESQENAAELIAVISSQDTPGTTPPNDNPPDGTPPDGTPQPPTDTPPLPEVPLPAGGLLLISGLIALVFFPRRAKTARHP